jgi:hypothetical protein
MTIEDFQKSYGAAYRKFARTDLYTAMVDVLREQSPVKQQLNQTPGNLIAGESLFFAQSVHHEKIMRLIETSFRGKPEAAPSEPDYTTPTFPEA